MTAVTASVILKESLRYKSPTQSFNRSSDIPPNTIASRNMEKQVITMLYKNKSSLSTTLTNVAPPTAKSNETPLAPSGMPIHEGVVRNLINQTYIYFTQF